MTELPATLQSTEEKRELALLKAIGLDRAAPEQREIALAIANRYGLDLMLKHLVLVDGRPYITRDGLLHIAHRSGKLDGMETSEPIESDGYWRVSCSVYRKDMTRPFTYFGRYPTKGGNQKYAPEMATKVAESMAMRRAFDVAAPSQDERWDIDQTPIVHTEPQRSLAEKAAEKRASIGPSPALMDAPLIDVTDKPYRAEDDPKRITDATPVAPVVEVEADATPEPVAAPEPPTDATVCGEPSPYGEGSEPCNREQGHNGNHKNHDRESW
jgi:hypothetical protein